ncbi:MAG: IS200/IS605 family transposase [Bacteroidetes bacterium]|nr:MAG: IS200/IS605 family transposase [Bacteroidota bacterium]REK03560.1 MAG: IS200/IS605 family transposase [Bacteroidota bacterium]REK34614.1 MAG: IS200/IS605 family transposase [Bacteroidota bacterium]REK50427.1 MAG: IS200/IS605 family transposase [Bacteroidota bacterium]
MSTYTQILYQIVYGTYRRQKTMCADTRQDLYKFMTGLLQHKKCHVYRINGVEDHVHILISLNPTVALSTLVKDLKLASTAHIKQNNLFPVFNGWAEGYGAFTYSLKEKDRLIEYIKNQEEHHKKQNSEDELRSLLKEHNVKFDERYFS